MDLTFSAEEAAFRDEVREFLANSLPEDLASKGEAGGELTKADMERWHAILNERGWLAVTWPKAHGGTGWSAVERQATHWGPEPRTKMAKLCGN